jgi:AraC-like DNA-binding protein
MGRNEVIDAEALGQCARQVAARRGFEQLLRRLDEDTLAAARTRDRARLAAIAAEAADGFASSAAAEPARADRLVSLLAYFLARLAAALDVEPEGPGGADLHAELRRPRSAAELAAHLRAALEHLAAAREERQAGANGFLARRARELVDADPCGDCSLSAVAARLCVHPSYLSRIYKAETGESFLEHVIGARMREARRLLKESNRRVHEVAEALGYRDVNHFTRTFRRVVGVSPSEFRALP